MMERKRLSLGSQPWFIIAFQDLRFTSVTTGKLPKRLGPLIWVEVIQGAEHIVHLGGRL